VRHYNSENILRAFELRPDLRLLLFISEAPCGDASIIKQESAIEG